MKPLYQVPLTLEAISVLEEQFTEETPTHSDVILGMHDTLNIWATIITEQKEMLAKLREGTK